MYETFLCFLLVTVVVANAVIMPEVKHHPTICLTALEVQLAVMALSHQ